MRSASRFRAWRLPGFVALYLALTTGSFAAARYGMELAVSAHTAAQTATGESVLQEALRFAPRVIVREAGEPERLRIPRLGIDAPVERVGLTDEGAMDVPKDFWNVGWYDLGPRPGERGNSVIAGHLDTMTGAAVFAKLPSLRAGDLIEVTDDRGVTRTFEVERKQAFTDENAPMREIFGSASGTSLNLITCGGAWNEKEGRYEQRIVVFAKLIDEELGVRS